MKIHDTLRVEFTREELARREALRLAEQSELLDALFATDGFAYVPDVSLESGFVVLGAGSAVGSVNGQRRLVRLPPQRVALTTVPGSYSLYVKPDAWIDTAPQVLADQTVAYADGEAVAYASGQLAAGEGVIRVIGLMLTVPEAAGEHWLELAQVTVPDDPTQTTASVVAPLATLRGASESGPGTEGALLADGSVPLAGNLRLGGHALSGVSGITGVSGKPVAANVTHLGGMTLAQLLNTMPEPGGTDGGDGAYRVSFAQDLSLQSPAPRALRTTLPEDALPSGLDAVVAFTGAGTLTKVDGRALTFMPEVRGRLTRFVSWPTMGEGVLIGSTVGVSGQNPAYFTSVSFNRPAVDGTAAEHRRVLLRTSPAGVVSVFDQEITPNDPPSAPLPPYPLGTSGTVLTWGGKPQNMTLTPGGDANDLSVNTVSAYVAGTRLLRADQEGMTIEDLTLVVQGAVTVHAAPDIPTLVLS